MPCVNCRKDTVHVQAVVALATHAVQVKLADLRPMLLSHIVTERTRAALQWHKYKL